MADAAASAGDVAVEAVDRDQSQAQPPCWRAAQPPPTAQHGSQPCHTSLSPQVAAAGHRISAAQQPQASACAAAKTWATSTSTTSGFGTIAPQMQLGEASGPAWTSVFEAAAQAPVQAAAAASATVVAPTYIHRSMSGPCTQLQTQEEPLGACAPSAVALTVPDPRPPGLPGLPAWSGLGLSAPSVISAPSVMMKPMKRSYKPQKMQQLEREVLQARERNQALKAQLGQLQQEVATASTRLGMMRQQYEQQQETNKRLRMDMSYAKDMVTALRQHALAGWLCT